MMSRNRLPIVFKLITTLGLYVILHGCTVAGPNAISSGRLAYNEAIAETSDQQMLMVLVHNRYEESHHMLAVASVTANVRVSSQVGVEIGVGDSDNYDGNLVPFRGGFIYEENPTISYVPVSGEAYLGQIMSPAPISIFIQISGSLPHPEHAYVMLLSSVNGIRNPAFLYSPRQHDPRFDRLIALMNELIQTRCLSWTRSPSNPREFLLAINPSTELEADKARELLGLLGLSNAIAAGDSMLVPVFDKQQTPGAEGIGISTYSIMQLVQVLSSAVEVPEEHNSNGMATQFPPSGRAGRNIHIKYSESRPESAYVAAEYKDGWFYIDDHDLSTKRYFKLLGHLWSAAMAKSLTSGPSTPVLTVPVSR